jgi:Peptidase family M1 domain
VKSSPLDALGLLLAGLCLAPAAASSAERPELPPAVYRVEIAARYDPASRTVTGSEQLLWRNTSEAAVSELRFHLYLNAFAGPRTTFMREARGIVPLPALDEATRGWIEVRSLRLAGGEDLQPRGRFERPDDDNPDDRTVAVYPLPEPLLPGGAVALTIEFEARLPAVIARTGARGDFVVAAQWFPEIGVFEAAGVRGRTTAGWDVHQFHARSEFYADFGSYDVTLRLPRRYRGKIGATGSLVSEEMEGDEVVARFVQKGVHDFAWAADPRFEVVAARFDPDRDVSPAERSRAARLLGVGEEQLDLPPVDLRLLIEPDHRRLAARYLAAARAAIAHLGLHLGPYPYPTLTLVDPSFGADEAGGMEYPTLVLLGAPALAALPGFRRVLLPEIVTVHEFAHQYFYGMVANDQAEESWLDEGLATFYEGEVLKAAYGPYAYRLGDLRIPLAETLRPPARLLSDPVDTPTWRFRSHRSWLDGSYGRPAAALSHLRNLVGPPDFARALRAYFEGWRWRHPDTADFEASMAASLAPRRLGWFFAQAFHSTRRLDYAVESLACYPLPEQTLFRCSAEVVRRREFRHPVTVEFRFDDERVLRRRWQGDRRWARWTFTGPARLTSAEVDPDHLMTLDVDRLDDSQTREPQRAPTAKAVAQLLFWLENLFAGAALFA